MAEAREELLEKISATVSRKACLVEDGFPEYVLSRLESAGYKADVNDAFAIAFGILAADEDICSACNQRAIPNGLFMAAVDQMAGRILNDMYSSGRLDIETLDLSGIVTSVKEGDTAVSFDKDASDADKFTAAVSIMMNRGKDKYTCYRRLRW